MACVRAALSGRPPPELRVPCFFNPQHGPSATDVEWRFPRHSTRRYPVCRQCAGRVEAHRQPDVRMVRIGSRDVPYWEAGTSCWPYVRGYFDDAQGLGVAMTWAWTVQQADRMGGSLGLTGAGDFGGDGGGFDAGFDGGFD